tara:strand:- start:6201 stop:7130 length:930 start_codon:yes stop_codon:yes gene_type:complete
MATTTNITSTYQGEFAGKYIASALLSANTIDKGGITVMPNVKYKAVVKKLAVTDVLADGDCDFQATSTVSLTERVIEPKSLKVNLQLCKADYRSDWDAISMGYSAFDELPKSFADFLIGHVSAKVALKMEQNIWSGDKNNGGEFDGLLTLLSTDADLPSGQEIASATVSASTIEAELGKIVDAIPSAIYGKEDLRIYISQAMHKAYVRALGSAGYLDRYANQDLGTDLMFDGIKLFVANGLVGGQAIATTVDNIFFGCGLQNDENVVKLIDMEPTDGSENVRLVMKMTGAVQYYNVEEIVTYGVTNSAN